MAHLTVNWLVASANLRRDLKNCKISGKDVIDMRLVKDMDDTAVEDEVTDADMTAVNAVVSEVPCVRIPLQTTYVSPTSPETTIFMYTSNADNQGSVELHLPDAADSVDEKTFTSVFAKLEQDQDSYTISYQDDSNPVLSQNNIDILLGAAALQSNDNNVDSFELFDTKVKPETELISSPKSLVSDAERSSDSKSSTNQATTTEDPSPTCEEGKNYSDTKSPTSGKKCKPKASSPSGWGPQQCSVCSKVFGNTSALAKHKLTHSDERKYGCATCGKAFKRQDHLNGHMLTHRHKKPFECKADGCGKSYCDARSLRRHTENHHVHPSLPISTPTISVQEVISNTSNIPTCIHYAPKGTQSFHKNNSSCAKLPKTTAILMEKSIVLKASNQVPSKQTEPSGDSSSPNASPANNATSNPPAKEAKNGDQNKPECKPVECNLCHRKFKNVPALNGHMRLHGGYFKKENDAKKWEKKESNGPQLTTASISVRALIEEKIIQKRSTALNAASRSLTSSQTILKPKLRQNEILTSKLKSNVITVKEEPLDVSVVNDYHPKVSSFAIPAAPSQQQQQVLPSISADVLKRGNSKEENYSSSPSIQEETLMFNELLLKREHQKQIKRASSDPGTTASHNIQSPQIDVTFSPESAYLDVYQNQNGQYFTNNLTDEMFQNVQDADTMLLHNVDTANELNNLSQIQSSDFQEINLEEYQSDLQHQDLQAVLNSPLPVSLAEFSYMQTDPVIANQEPSISYSQSPLPSPSFTYPTPPASQEGQSPSFCHATIVHPNRVSSPLSTAFYSSGMSSPGAVEAALNEVLPMDVNQNVYPSPASPSPLPVTPEPSPVSLSTPGFTQTDLYSGPDADEGLLATNQKEFVFQNGGSGPDDEYKFMEGDRIYDHDYRNVILDCNRLMEAERAQFEGCAEGNTITLQSECGQRVTLQGADRADNITLYADDSGDLAFDGRVTVRSKDCAERDMFAGSGFGGQEVRFEEKEDTLFYEKEVCAFHMEERGITLYAGDQRRENITLHSENQGHVVLHSDDKGNMIIQDRGGLNFHVEENNNYDQRITLNAALTEGCHPENITLHIGESAYDQRVTFTQAAVKDGEETYIIKTSPSSFSITSNLLNSRKRHHDHDLRFKYPQRSRLRVHRHSAHMLHYTPCPMLNPLRNSSGLYWQASLSNTNAQNHKENDFGRDVPKNELLIESDEDPHINIGSHFQANVELFQKSSHPSKNQSPEDLVWEPAIKHGVMDNEVDMYLEFACCAALPGGGRNKEYALHILHLCQGNIHEAVLKLMQPKLHVPSDHPLLTYEYPENDAWNAKEIEIFQQSILKFDKNFYRIAQHIGTKTTKQCVQFYYLWKKACPDEYKRIRLNWRRIREMNFQNNTIIPISNINVASEVEVIATSTDSRPFACVFPDCLARFNSRAALNGHNRIHGGSADRWRMMTPTPFNNSSSSTNSSDTTEEFPCKLCGKVFSKIKSRSAHMKSHRPSEMEPKKSKLDLPRMEQIDHNNQIFNSTTFLKKTLTTIAATMAATAAAATTTATSG